MRSLEGLFWVLKKTFVNKRILHEIIQKNGAQKYESFIDHPSSLFVA